MSDLANKINQDLVISMKEKDKVATSTLRLLISEIKNEQIAKGKELDDEEVVKVVSKSIKKTRESIEAYKKAGRNDLVEKEEAELKVLEKYLPEQMSEEEIGKIVEEVIGESGAGGVADMGKIMGLVMARLKGQADGKNVSEIVKKKLAS